MKSHEAGLSVPDWPTTYGYQMFAFPWSDMVGGIFYEHGHRMLATFLGALTLIMAFWLGLKEKRKPVKLLGYTALVLVIVQGLLGGLTVLFFLPVSISLLHGVVAQTFFLVVILIAFSQSKEFHQGKRSYRDGSYFYILALLIAVFIQLIIGAWMRHTESGLAIYDFPKMAGAWLPLFNHAMLKHINDWRFNMDLPDVTLFQVMIHFIHRLGALVIFVLTVVTHYKMIRYLNRYSRRIKRNLYFLDSLILIQILLGAFTIWSAKGPFITSFHVMNGAMVMGACFLLLLRLSDLSFLRAT
ncbi:MAG: heme A synthase [Fidelibacterota bacterium]